MRSEQRAEVPEQLKWGVDDNRVHTIWPTSIPNQSDIFFTDDIIESVKLVLHHHRAGALPMTLWWLYLAVA